MAFSLRIRDKHIKKLGDEKFRMEKRIQQIMA